VEEGVDAEDVCIVMKKEYDNKLQEEVERILKELYYNPIPNQPRKIGVIQTEKRYVDYLVDNKLVSNLDSVREAGKWGLELLSNGYEVFKKYGGWRNYKRKVINKQERVNRAKELAARFWWIPVVISAFSLVLSLMALLL
jgi:hypothetical protein